jgi:hypothetical protein
LGGAAFAAAPPATNPQGGSIGLEGHITGSAPSTGPTITTPSSGSSFTTLPVRVAGLCSSGLLVEVFKNNVFSGSVKCANGSYSLQVDLFSGKNDLTARQYDGLNRASPDSNKVSVTFNDQIAVAGPRISLQTAYATRGANPGSELSWPLTISGGTEPYAVSVDWGDGSDPELLSQKTAGDFNINHVYKVAGSYNVTIKASDASQDAAFLQVVAIGNGAIQQSTGTASNAGGTGSGSRTKETPWLIIGMLGAMVILSFWLGQKHQLSIIRSRLSRGVRPF